MSFLTEATARRLSLTSASRIVMIQTPRQFSTSIAMQKTVTEAAKDTIKNIDHKVSDKIVDGINIGSNVAHKVTGKVTEASGSAEEIRSKMKSQAEELKGKAKGATEEAKGKVKENL